MLKPITSKPVPIYMTPACAKRLRAELKALLYTDRPILAKAARIAAEEGDRSENYEYQATKRAMRKMDGRIRFLTKRIENLEVVDPVKQGGIANGRVLFGCTVTIEDEDGDEKKYSIVGIDEYDAGKGKVSWVSPIGKALLKSSIGDVVTLKAPNGNRELEVLNVEYLPID
jgi:transcription elongation factor GreB